MPIIGKIVTEQLPTTYPIIYYLYRGFMWLAFRLLTNCHVEGAENVPPDGTCILASNHLTMLDAPLVYSSTKRWLYGLAAAKYKGKHIIGLTTKIGRVVYIRRGEFDREALKQCFAILNAGEALFVPVEGTRSTTGGLLKGKTGVAYLATRSEAVIVPVAFWGVDTVISDLKRFKRPSVYIRFGEPYSLPAGRARGADLDLYTEELMGKIAAMLPETYRGVYKDHPLVTRQAVTG